LLPVPESRVGNKHVLCRIDRDDPVVEIDPADIVIGKDILLEVRLRNLLEIKFPKVRMLVIEYLFVFVPFCHLSGPPSS